MRLWLAIFLGISILSGCGPDASTGTAPNPELVIYSGDITNQGTITNNPDNPNIAGLSFSMGGKPIKVIPAIPSDEDLLSCDTIISGSMHGFTQITNLHLDSITGVTYSISGAQVSGHVLNAFMITKVNCHSEIVRDEVRINEGSASIERQNLAEPATIIE